MLRNVFGRSHIRQFQSAHPRRVRFLSDMEIITRAVSIRAPVRDAIATHSKIRPLRATSPPLSKQNQRILRNPFQRPHPCARPRRENTCRFYVRLGGCTRTFLWLISPLLCRGCNFSVATAKRPSSGLTRSPTKRRVRPC